MDEQLLGCPFCDATDAFSERADLSSSYVVCNNCLARGPVQCQDSDDEEEPGQASAIAAWNTRAAQGTEAQRATTVEQGVVHDGPVRDSECAHTSSGGGK